MTISDRSTVTSPPVPLLPSNPALQRLFARIADLSAFSVHAQDIVRLSNRSSGSLADLQKLIQADPSLVALILRRVNSSYYRLDPQITDLSTAARLLGVREFRNLAVTVYLSRMFELSTDVGSFRVAGLWSHSVAVAAAAHLVSRVCGCGIPADAYIAGLLHDIGLLLVNRHMRRRFALLVDRVRKRVATSVVEREVYSFDHAQLGGYVARQWNFPAAVVDAIQYHHEAELYAGSHRDLVFVVTAADYLCSRAGWTSMGVHNVPLPADVVYRALGLDQLALAIIWEELIPTLERAASLATV
ncbi:MAG: HDOD domain-containing protein [Pirellulaceae bacterium]